MTAIAAADARGVRPLGTCEQNSRIRCICVPCSEQMTPGLRDPDLRAALTDRVARQYAGKEYLLVPELDVYAWEPGRLDAMLITDRLHGFEIKSDVDSLRRLPRQVEIYGPYLERATLITTGRHLEAAASMVPPWWGLWTVSRRRDQLSVKVVRAGRLNSSVDPYAVSTFIYREALVKFLRDRGATGLSKLDMWGLRTLLVQSYSRRQVLELARSVMLAHRGWRCRNGAIAHEIAS